MIMVHLHGGTSPTNAVHNAVVLEQVAEMTYHTMQINPTGIEMSQNLLDKHYLRKNGKDAYYGQN